MSLSQTQSNTAILDSEIANLSVSLITLQEMARSFPVGVTLPVEKRAAFDRLFDSVAQQFEQAAYSLEAAGIPADAVLF